MKKLFILIIVTIISLTIYSDFSYGITYLDKPKNQVAYSSGSNIILEWKYTISLPLGDYSFEIEEYVGTSWIKVAEVKYPTVKKVLQDNKLEDTFIELEQEESFFYQKIKVLTQIIFMHMYLQYQ